MQVTLAFYRFGGTSVAGPAWGVGQAEFSFHEPIRSMFLDGEICRESAVLKLV